MERDGQASDVRHTGDPWRLSDVMNGVERSELVARRALGLALDPTVGDGSAAAALAALSGGDPRLFALARARIVRAATLGEVSARALALLEHAGELSDAETP